MIPLFIGLTLANLLFLLTSAALGYMALDRPASGEWHRLAGALSALACCGVHCVVFTYFMATGKWVQHAVDIKRLDPALVGPTRSFKAQAFPAALGAILAVVVVAMLGAATDVYRISRTIHHVAALVMILANLAAAFVEYHAIRRNGLLIAKVLSDVAATNATNPPR